MRLSLFLWFLSQFSECNMPFPFRNPTGYGDTGEGEQEWTPPDYAKPVTAAKAGEAWKPPDYATPVKAETKKQPSVFSRAVEALKPAKTIKPTGSLLPGFLKPSTEPISYEESLKRPEQKGLFSTAVEAASKFLSEHPKIREAGQRFLTGTSPEFEAEGRKRGVTGVHGQEIMSIPGVKQATDYLSQKVAGSEGNTRLAAGAVIQALGGILEGGFDPRTAGVKGELPIRQPSREIPYRMETAPKIEVPSSSTAIPAQAPKTEEVPPIASVAPVEAKKPFVSPFEKKPEEKPLEQVLQEFGGSGHPEEPDYVNKVLTSAGKGEPGLAVEDKDVFKHVVYRDKSGEPIAVAKVVTGPDGKPLVQDLAANKDKGLLTGRAMKSLGEKLKEIGATEPAGTMSEDAMNFMSKMKEKAAKPKVEEWKPPEYAKAVETPEETPILRAKDIKKAKLAAKPRKTVEDLFSIPKAEGVEEAAKGIEVVEPERTSINASGESAASQEAINRQASMKSKGEQYVVYDKSGNARPLIGPEAVDYQPRPGETFGIITQKRGFRVLEDRGGKVRGGGLAEFATSESGGMPIGPKTPGGGLPFEGPQGRVLNKLFNALEDAKSNVSEQANINKVERARRFAAFESVKEEGAAGAAKSLSKLRGEFEKIQPSAALASQLKNSEIDQLFTAIKRANITSSEKANGITALFKIMQGESTPVRSELKILDDVFGNGFADKITEMHGGLGMVGLKVTKLASTMKSMENALSLAAPLR